MDVTCINYVFEGIRECDKERERKRTNGLMVTKKVLLL